MAKPTVLVTGASGFIGRETVRFLASKRWQVYAFSRQAQKDEKGVNWVQGDIRDKELLRNVAKNVDYIVHLASRKSDESDSWDVNVGGVYTLLEVARQAKIRKIINVSTASVKLSRKGTYALTKAEADRIFEESGMPVVTLRPSLVYGNKEEGAFGALVRASSLPIIPVFGSGKVMFWPIHVADIAELIERALINDLKESSYDVGGTEALSMNQLLIQLAKKKYGREKAKILHLPPTLGLATARIMRLISHKPVITESNILGSIQSIIFTPEKILGELHFQPRTLEQRLVNNKELLKREARLLIRYVFSHYLSDADLVRLASRFLIAHKSNGLPDRIVSSLFLRFPSLLGMFDVASRLCFKESLLQKKILVAAAIVETDRVSAEFLLPSERSLINLGLNTFIVIVQAAFTMTCAFIIMATPGWKKHVN